MSKPLVLHLDPVRYGQTSWDEFSEVAEVVHIGEYTRSQFIEDLNGKYSNVVAIARGYLTGTKVGRFDEELISQFPPSLKYIAHQGAGYDQNDVEPLTKRGIQLSNCPDTVTNSTADINLFLMLGAMRNFEAGRRNLLAGKWPSGGFGAGVKEGINPRRKILGIIAMGKIGRAFRDRAEVCGFEKIIYYNRKRLPPTEEKNSEYVSSIEELAKLSDVISINCPLNESTHHLVDDDLISKMKDGVILVNTARGAIIDEKCLVKHLRSGKVGAAGLDVYEREPYPTEELLQMPNVMALPHMGTHAIQTVFDMENHVIQNIRSGITTGNVITVVPEQEHIDFHSQ